MSNSDKNLDELMNKLSSKLESVHMKRPSSLERQRKKNEKVAKEAEAAAEEYKAYTAARRPTAIEKAVRGVVRQTETAKFKKRKHSHSTARRGTQKKGVKSHTRANLFSARRKRQAETAKAAKKAQKEYNERVKREEVILQGRTRSHEKELGKNQEMK